MLFLLLDLQLFSNIEYCTKHILQMIADLLAITTELYCGWTHERVLTHTSSYANERYVSHILFHSTVFGCCCGPASSDSNSIHCRYMWPVHRFKFLMLHFIVIGNFFLSHVFLLSLSIHNVPLKIGY